MTSDKSIFNGAMDLLDELQEHIADGKVKVNGYTVDRDHRRFVYTIRVEEPYVAPGL